MIGNVSTVTDIYGLPECHRDGEHEFDNRRNGHMSKQVQTSMGAGHKHSSWPLRHIRLPNYQQT